MDSTKMRRIGAVGVNLTMKVREGHFATNHTHINYYLDMTAIKASTSKAQEIASALVNMYLQDTVIDTIVCMEGTEIIGAFLAEELSKGGFMNVNAYKTIYIVPPEYNSNSQIIFRDNLLPMIREKHIMILTATVTSGLTVNKAMESIQYYGGTLTGISAVFSALSELNGMPIFSVFGRADLPEYAYYDYRHCPFCREGKKLDALVNPFGYSEL